MHVHIRQKRTITCILTLWRPETPKRVLWKIVKTQMKWRIMQHSIRVSTVCFDKTSIFRESNIFFEIISFDPSINTMDRPDLTVSKFMRGSRGVGGGWIGVRIPRLLENHRFYRNKHLPPTPWKKLDPPHWNLGK